MIHPSPFIARPRRRAAAFSVIELMVAVAVLSIIIVGLLAMFYQTQRAFRSGATQTDVLEGGRATLQVLARELQEMSASRLSGITNFVNVNRMDFPLALPGGGIRDNVLQDVAFLTKENDDWFCTSYRIKDAGNGVGTLYRFVTNAPVRPTNAINNVVQLVSTVIAASPETESNWFHRVTEGVVHFRLLAYDRNGVLYQPTNILAGFFMNAGVTAFSENSLPAYVDLELGVLEPRALEQVRVHSYDSNFLAQQTARMHLFRQRIPIRNAP